MGVVDRQEEPELQVGSHIPGYNTELVVVVVVVERPML